MYQFIHHNQVWSILMKISYQLLNMKLENRIKHKWEINPNKNRNWLSKQWNNKYTNSKSTIC